jgi:23S rRNA U2552 (ribose-2'-O)-methylase RlmE/FtsJ
MEGGKPMMEGGGSGIAVKFVDEKTLTGGADADVFPYFHEELKPAKGENIDMKKTSDIPKKFLKLYGRDAMKPSVQEIIRGVSHRSVNLFSKKYEVTNAYVKLMEIFRRFNINYTNEVKHFDLCAAPGLFIKAMESICEDKGWKYTYNACSLKGGLPWDPSITNKFDFDILKDTLEDKHIAQYNLVTSDVGVKYDPNILVEEQMFELQDAQLKHALLLLARGGNCILKMFTCSTNLSCAVVDTFSRHFKHSYICKPISSRILNDECYLVGLDFDEKGKGTVGTNSGALIKFEEKRAEIREKMWDHILEIARLYDNQTQMLDLYVTPPKVKLNGGIRITDSEDEGEGESGIEEALAFLLQEIQESDSESEEEMTLMFDSFDSSSDSSDSESSYSD